MREGASKPVTPESHGRHCWRCAHSVAAPGVCCHMVSHNEQPETPSGGQQQTFVFARASVGWLGFPADLSRLACVWPVSRGASQSKMTHSTPCGLSSAGRLVQVCSHEQELKIKEKANKSFASLCSHPRCSGPIGHSKSHYNRKRHQRSGCLSHTKSNKH
ncbi:hypothetical protein HJG60_008379 [Phyllostomus discolor]|uniref:Uncharacterized protein n=1 Tax=Phyllostomus discolor TaxID=89673 RepID=A0A833Z439_9CHIR|nr:hypothetical protein HJG60_008379 [Phyllostomus discolor]